MISTLTWHLTLPSLHMRVLTTGLLEPYALGPVWWMGHYPIMEIVPINTEQSLASSALYTVYITLYITLKTVYCKPYSGQSIPHTVHFTLSSVHCTVHGSDYADDMKQGEEDIPLIPPTKWVIIGWFITHLDLQDNNQSCQFLDMLDFLFVLVKPFKISWGRTFKILCQVLL